MRDAMSLRLLGAEVPRRVLARGAAVAAVTWLLRLTLPVAAWLAGERHLEIALVVVATSVAVSALRALAIHRATVAVRALVYGALARALDRVPVLGGPRLPSSEQIENEIARGAPWVEALVGLTLPSIAGDVLAIGAIAALAVVEVGARATLVGAAALAGGIAVGALASRTATAAAVRAWDRYQAVARLIESGLRGRAEIRAHDLGAAHMARIASHVDAWSHLERRAYGLAALTGWSVPLVTLALGLALAAGAGFDAQAFVGAALGHPTASTVGAGLLAASALPTLVGFARGLSDLATARPYLAALERLVSAATDDPPGAAPSAPAPTQVALDAVVQLGEPGACVRVEARFTWARGETLALMGPNGCGKTTAALLAIGLVPPDAGRVDACVAGAPTPAGPALAGRVAYLPAQAFLDDGDDVREAVRFVAPDADDEAIVRTLGRLFAGGEPAARAALERRVTTLSAGERRLVALARVLLRDADWVVLDEPEASLDADARDRVTAVLRDALSARSALVVTHDRTLATLASRVLRFEGHAVRDDEPSAPRT